MATAQLFDRAWTAAEFIQTDQSQFGPLWRYELVEGEIIGHAAPAPEHGAIAAGLTGVLFRLLAGRPEGCRPEVGSASVPRTEQRNTARIPDVLIRCGEDPVVAFEIVSPSEIRDWRARDRKRQHLQSVHGMREIVELYQDDYAVHVYRRSSEPGSGQWHFEAIGGRDAVLRLETLGLELPLSEIYMFSDISKFSPLP